MQRRKKKILFFTVSLAVIIPFLANADNKNNPGNVNAQENKNFVNVEEEVLDESVIQENQNENQVQNQVKTENAGEEKQLRVNTEEVLQAGEEIVESQVGKVKNYYAEFYGGSENFVAEKVKELLDIDNMQGGIGQRVKEIATQQQQAQEAAKEQLNKIEARQGLMKKIFGADFGALQNLKQQLEQNEIRVNELQNLEEQIVDQTSQSQVQEAIQVLENQNQVLEKHIQLEEQEEG
jgi:hypothetical protein